jgi:hypothetical protein
MTTFTTEDRQNASPPHIVDGGASHQTLGDFIAHKKMVNDLLEENEIQKRVIQSLSETGQRLYDENRHLKESIRSISNQLINMMDQWEFKQ